MKNNEASLKAQPWVILTDVRDRLGKGKWWDQLGINYLSPRETNISVPNKMWENRISFTAGIVYKSPAA